MSEFRSDNFENDRKYRTFIGPLILLFPISTIFTDFHQSKIGEFIKISGELYTSWNMFNSEWTAKKPSLSSTTM